jgi:hypothetical protein
MYLRRISKSKISQPIAKVYNAISLSPKNQINVRKPIIFHTIFSPSNGFIVLFSIYSLILMSRGSCTAAGGRFELAVGTEYGVHESSV